MDNHNTPPIQPQENPKQNASHHDYWRANVKLIWILLVIWFVFSYGAGLIFADQLNHIQIAGFPLGFWFAEQGAIYVFILLIVTYTISMNRLDKKFDVEE